MEWNTKKVILLKRKEGKKQRGGSWIIQLQEIAEQPHFISSRAFFTLLLTLLNAHIILTITSYSLTKIQWAQDAHLVA